jgi:hypothetical protein
MTEKRCICDTRTPEDPVCPRHPKRARRAFVVSGETSEPTRAQIIRLPGDEPTRTRLEMAPRIAHDD